MRLPTHEVEQLVARGRPRPWRSRTGEADPQCLVLDCHGGNSKDPLQHLFVGRQSALDRFVCDGVGQAAIGICISDASQAATLGAVLSARTHESHRPISGRLSLLLSSGHKRLC
jgi:hypothetical protein